MIKGADNMVDIKIENLKIITTVLMHLTVKRQCLLLENMLMKT